MSQLELDHLSSVISLCQWLSVLQLEPSCSFLATPTWTPALAITRSPCSYLSLKAKFQRTGEPFILPSLKLTPDSKVYVDPQPPAPS